MNSTLHRRPRRLSVSLFAAFTTCLSFHVAKACTVEEGFVFATHSDQWLAAAFVVEGTALQVEYDEYDAPFSTVLLGDITTTKGSDLGCNTILVSGFSDFSLCGVNPPPKDSQGTYYLCSLSIEEDGNCTAELNSQGVFVGATGEVSLGEVDPFAAPPTCPQEADVCQSVRNCKPVENAPTPSPTPAPTSAPTPVSVWPPTVNSACVSRDEGRSIRPTGDGSRAWLRRYNSIHKCLRKCRRPQGYTHIVEDRAAGKCFCYNAQNSGEWEIEEDPTGREVLYNIEDCFKLPTKRCPTDQPGRWIDNPGFACKKFKRNGLKLKLGDTYLSQDNLQRLYNGTVEHCKALCDGERHINSPLTNCSWINYQQGNGACFLMEAGDCKNLRERDTVLSSIYCGAA